MKQTALQWFIEQLEFDESMSKEVIQPVIDKALKMEKKQIIDTIVWARDPYGMTMGPNTLSTEKGEKYYNQAFKSE